MTGDRALGVHRGLTAAITIYIRGVDTTFLHRGVVQKLRRLPLEEAGAYDAVMSDGHLTLAL